MSMKRRYRIVSDGHLGYEVQHRYKIWPFWIQTAKHGSINTFASIDKAKEWIKQGCPHDWAHKSQTCWEQE